MELPRVERRRTSREAPPVSQMAVFFVCMIALTAATALFAQHVPTALNAAGQLSASVVSAVAF